MEDPTNELLSGSRDRALNEKLRLRSKKLSQPAPPTHGVEKLANERIEEAQRAGQFDNLQGQHKQHSPPLTAARVGSIADQRIEQAIRDGEFDNLEGMGKPLNLYDDVHVPADMRLAFRMMKGKGFDVPWADAQREYERQIEAHNTWMTNNRRDWPSFSEQQKTALLAELKERIKPLNNLIHTLNNAVPNDTMRVGLLVYDRERRLLEDTL